MGKYSEHSTYFNKEKVEVPSVTTIMKVLNKPFISYFLCAIIFSGWYA